jgi:hypothetical protein
MRPFDLLGRRIGRAVLLLWLLNFSVRLAAAELPEGLSRFNPAGLAAYWHYDGTAFRALRAPPRGVASLRILRLHHPKRGYLLTGSDSEAASAESSGFVREGTAFFTPAKSRRPVFRFRNPQEGSFFYSTSSEGITGANFVLEGIAFYAYDAAPELHNSDLPDVISVARYRDEVTGTYLFTAAKESPYIVGAFYFGSFSSSAESIISGTERVHGRKNDWWGGVDDFYGEEPGIAADRRGWTGDWRTLKPKIGYYDQQSVETLEQHIRQASDAGLAFFSFYWYWSRIKRGERLPEALNSFLHASNVRLMKFNLSLYAHPWDDDLAIDPGSAPAVAQKLVEYFSHPQYLRLSDGRPVFVIGDNHNIRAVNGEKCKETACYEGALSAFLALLKKLSIERLGVAPFIQIQTGIPAWDRQENADGITCIVPPFTIIGETPYPAFTKEVFAPLLGNGRPVSPCMLENFDERPRQDVLIPDRNVVRFLVGKSDALFRQNLTVTKEFSDSEYLAGRHPAARIIYLYAWNEWHEGGILEPNAYTGARDLNIVTDVFQLPRSPSICLERGHCKTQREGEPR